MRIIEGDVALPKWKHKSKNFFLMCRNLRSKAKLGRNSQAYVVVLVDLTAFVSCLGSNERRGEAYMLENSVDVHVHCCRRTQTLL